MPNTTSSEFGDIVLVAFPFTDQLRQKKRPAVVISTRAYNDVRPDLILKTLGQLGKKDQHALNAMLADIIQVETVK